MQRPGSRPVPRLPSTSLGKTGNSNTGRGQKYNKYPSSPISSFHWSWRSCPARGGIGGLCLLAGEKHDGRDQVAGRGEGVHEVPTVVIRVRIQEGFPSSPPASSCTIHDQIAFAKPNCELYRILDNLIPSSWDAEPPRAEISGRVSGLLVCEAARSREASAVPYHLHLQAEG